MSHEGFLFGDKSFRCAKWGKRFREAAKMTTDERVPTYMKSLSCSKCDRVQQGSSFDETWRKKYWLTKIWAFKINIYFFFDLKILHISSKVWLFQVVNFDCSQHEHGRGRCLGAWLDQQWGRSWTAWRRRCINFFWLTPFFSKRPRKLHCSQHQQP